METSSRVYVCRSYLWNACGFEAYSKRWVMAVIQAVQLQIALSCHFMRWCLVTADHFHVFHLAPFGVMAHTLHAAFCWCLSTHLCSCSTEYKMVSYMYMSGCREKACMMTWRGKIPRPSPTIFAYCNQSKTAGLGMDNSVRECQLCLQIYYGNVHFLLH